MTNPTLNTLFPSPLAGRRLCAVALAGTIGLFVTPAAAQQLRFSTTAPGGIASTGNTLGLAKAQDENGPGVEHSIGTFITLDPTMVDVDPPNPLNPWPQSTTADWSQNGSRGVLALPVGAQVLHAELVWAGSYHYWPEDVTAFIDDPVTLLAGDDQTQVGPDPATAITLADTSHVGFDANYYLRSADVTSFVQAHGSGDYAVAGVPATQGDYTDTLSAAGWSLVVAYRHDGAPIRNLSVFVGGTFVDEDSQVDYAVSGFCAPPYGVVEGKAIISSLEGDANLTGDELAIGQTQGGSFVTLSGPNNPEGNFFCSQINDADGHLDTSGSFGDDNHDALAGVNVSGARQGWDLTTVALSSAQGHLSNDQTSAVLRTTTTGDSYFPVLVAMALDVKSPDFSGSKTEPSLPVAEIGDELTVTTSIQNSGEAQATDMTLALPLEAGLELQGFALDGQDGDIGGQPVTATALAQGVAVGDLLVGDTKVVQLAVKVVGAPDDGASFHFEPSWGHSFQVCSGEPAIDESFAAPPATVQYHQEPPATGTGGADPGVGGSAPVEPAIDSPEDPAGCGCRTAGERRASPFGGWLLLAAAGALSWLRRRR